MNEQKEIAPCPWCKRPARSYLNGSYVEGWTAFVECSDYECGTRGPTKQTKGFSNDEHVVENQAIEAWNAVAEKR